MTSAPTPAPWIDAERDGPVLVGYSGGLDSTVLLHTLADRPDQRARGLRAVHVHHGLHAAADGWAAHCAAVCADVGVPLQIVHVRVDGSGGHGPEGAARLARHAAFSGLLADGEILALAHHLDDQAETFLLRALRSAGPDGLGAMRSWRRHDRGWLWRPLLDTPRTDLAAWAHARHMRWVEDPSNAAVDADRNFLRNAVLPVLRNRWPHAGAALARSARLSAQAVDLLADEDAGALASAATLDPAVLRAEIVLALPAARRARVLRRWIDTLGLPSLPAQGVARIERDLLTARPDADAAFAWADARVLSWRGLLHAARTQPPLAPDLDLPWWGDTALHLPDGGCLVLEGPRGVRFEAPVRVHARRGGERIRLPGRTHAHALKHVLQTLDVPPWERAHLPLLSTTDATLLAAGDLAISASLDAWLRSREARLRWTSPGHDLHGRRTPAR